MDGRRPDVSVSDDHIGFDSVDDRLIAGLKFLLADRHLAKHRRKHFDHIDSRALEKHIWVVGEKLV